jgi:hypothetical protein
MTDRPCFDVAVLMRRERLSAAASRWQSWRWALDSVVPQQEGFGEKPRRLLQDPTGERWLHPGFRVELFRDDAEGYQLNASTPAPCWFVLWRMEEEAQLGEEPVAVPVVVSLSYTEAGRWLDAQETVEQVPAPPEVVAQLRDFVAQHLVQEPKRRQRPESFRPLSDRFGNPASIRTDKPRGGRGG